MLLELLRGVAKEGDQEVLGSLEGSEEGAEVIDRVDVCERDVLHHLRGLAGLVDLRFEVLADQTLRARPREERHPQPVRDVGQQRPGPVLLRCAEMDEAVTSAKEQLEVVEGVMGHTGFYLGCPSPPPGLP